MNINEFFNKVYTVAFRLTDDEIKAGDMACFAIESNLSDINLTDKVSVPMLKRTAKEVCKLFISQVENNTQVTRKFQQHNSEARLLQDALMSLSPISRVTIVWRDLLGFKIGDIREVGYSKGELYSELSNGRRQMKEILKDIVF